MLLRLEERMSGVRTLTADFVQENAPEREDLKKDLLAQLDAALKPEAIIASSTSGYMPSDLQSRCTRHPERVLVGHPFNPVYVLPLVEIVGGEKTAPEACERAARFYEAMGMHALTVRTEVPGHLSDRLQEALWREALHMVANGEATPEQIDAALINGPGPRLALMGQCMAFHVACGEGGMATNLDQFGPALKLPWSRLAAPELTKDLRDRMVGGCNAMAAGRRFEELAAARDRGLVAILKAIRESASGS